MSWSQARLAGSLHRSSGPNDNHSMQSVASFQVHHSQHEAQSSSSTPGSAHRLPISRMGLRCCWKGLGLITAFLLQVRFFQSEIERLRGKLADAERSAASTQAQKVWHPSLLSCLCKAVVSMMQLMPDAPSCL